MWWKGTSGCILQAAGLDSDLDALYNATFGNREVDVAAEDAAEPLRERFETMTEAAFRELGRDRPKACPAHVCMGCRCVHVSEEAAACCTQAEQQLTGLCRACTMSSGLQAQHTNM